VVIERITPQLAWLLEKGGPIIRYRTARELLGFPASKLKTFEKELLQTKTVTLWLDRLNESVEFSQIHSSKPTSFENALGKLTQLGCHAGIESFDAKTKFYRNWLLTPIDSSQFSWEPFLRMIVGSFLITAGYHHDPKVQAYLKTRLNTLWRFTREKDFDIYTNREHYSDIPKGFHDKPLVRPALYDAGENPLPTIYDIVALANYPVHLLSEDSLAKINAVIEYILHPKYQSFPEGYGLMRVGKRKYYAFGWSIHLPKYPGIEERKYSYTRLIQRVVLMSNFPTARNHPWFQECLKMLAEYRTEQGVYIFPRSYLPEKPSGYWVIGAYMGLEENRRQRIAIELESTFWMLKIRKNYEEWISPKNGH
jgi:hypothetical protein